MLILPLFLLRRHAFGLIIIAGIIYVAMQFTSAPKTQSKGNYSTNDSGQSGAPAIINPVTKVEDGNSMFSTDLMGQMNKEQAEYYGRVFYAVLGQVQDGTAYPWQQGDIAGTITPKETFKNGRGKTCRKFDEILKVGTIQQTINGQACHRGDGSWCKLKLSSTPACGLHTKPGMFDGLKNIF